VRWASLRDLGPGLVSGVSDNDPSGIGTYSQAGAALGFGACWIMPFCLPLVIASQEISARIGRVTGVSVIGAIGRHYPRTVAVMAALVVFANVVNLGADLGAMAEVLTAEIGGPRLLYVVLFGLGCAGLLIALRYQRYVRFTTWASFVLLAYFLTAFSVRIPWRDVLLHSIVPMLPLDESGISTLVAVVGTTISPYLFVWQSALEADRVHSVRGARAERSVEAARRIRVETCAGMAVAVLVAYAVIVTAAVTLHPAGVTEVQTAAQAAAALKPATGALAQAVFAAGIIGSGVLAVPMLAGSAAVAFAEARGLPVGLALPLRKAWAFYAFILLASLIGIALNFIGINPIRALIWSAVINGLLAVPVLLLVMLIASKRAVMGELAVRTGLATLGWLTTAVMAVIAVALLVILG
jgi:NRAMP (natural resistance-associated macrophage protein)-like metal ion transporter